MSGVKIAIHAMAEKEAKNSMYKLLKEKQTLLQEYEDYEQTEGLFDIPQEQAVKFIKEKKALQHEINIMHGYITMVTDLKRAFKTCNTVDFSLLLGRANRPHHPPRPGDHLQRRC